MKNFSRLGAALAIAACGVTLTFSGHANAEATEIRLAKQYGLGYLQLMVMQHDKLIEKHAKALGLGDIKTSWLTLGGGSVSNDALLSGNVDILGGGVGAFVTLWEKTRGGLEVKSPGTLGSFPMLLNTNNPNIKSIKDFTDNDKIALPAVRISPQAVTLQAAAAKIWGFENYARLDKLTVSLRHPEAVQALMSGKSEVDAHFATPPFMYMELKDPKIHTVLSSFEVWGGSQSATITWATSKFANANPMLMKAFDAALEEATRSINADKHKAAEIYVEMSKDKSGVEAVYKMISDPQLTFTTVPENIIKFTDFKFRTGTMKVKPETWKDLFFENVWQKSGS